MTDECRTLTCSECHRIASVSDAAPGASCSDDDCGGVMHLVENEDAVDVADIEFETDERVTADGNVVAPEDVSLTDDTDVVLDDLDGDGTIVGEALAEGIDRGRAEKLDDLVKDGYVPASQSIAFPPDDSSFVTTSDGTHNPPNFDEYTIDVEPEMAQKLLISIYNEIEDALRDGAGQPMTLVLGRPQYAVLEPWARATHGATFVTVLPEVEELVVVPGPMIHAARPPSTELFEYLEDEE